MRREQHYKDIELNKAIDELISYNMLKDESKQLLDKAQEYKERYKYIQAICYDKIRISGGERVDKMATVDNWVDLELKADEKSREAERKYWQIESKLEKLADEEKRILELYYIKRYDLQKIALIMNYCDVTIRTKKAIALKKYTNV